MTAKPISVHSDGLAYAGVPREVVEHLSLFDRDPADRAIEYDVGCRDGEVRVTMRLGPAVDRDAIHVTGTKINRVHESAQLRFPTFLALAWNLPDHELVWPSPVGIDVDDQGNATVECEIRDWEPAVEADLFGARGFPHRSTLVQVGEAENVEGTIPTALAEHIGVLVEDARVKLTFDCVDGRRVLVAQPTDADRSDVRNSVAIQLKGPTNQQARFGGKGVAAALGVLEDLAEDSVPLRWLQQDDNTLLAYVHEEGG